MSLHFTPRRRGLAAIILYLKICDILHITVKRLLWCKNKQMYLHYVISKQIAVNNNFILYFNWNKISWLFMTTSVDFLVNYCNSKQYVLFKTIDISINLEKCKTQDWFQVNCKFQSVTPTHWTAWYLLFTMYSQLWLNWENLWMI